MIPWSPRVFTIAPDSPFLEVLAKEILTGFPLSANDYKPPLTDWTILVPTRRAAREFIQILVRKSGHDTLFLPKIRPIGDLDDDSEIDTVIASGETPPISQNGILFLLQELVSDWASRNLHVELARSIYTSPQQRLGLALSLRTLLQQLDTQEMDLTNLPLAYEIELSEHRQAIVQLLELIHTALPSKLANAGHSTFASWRNRNLRREARDLAKDPSPKPIVVAGSTGTIPATRALLQSVSRHPMGAVVLPGLDLTLDDQSWKNLEPEHPQFSMRKLLEEMAIDREHVQVLGNNASSKSFLLSELFRPTSTAEAWHRILPLGKEALKASTEGIRLCGTKDRHLEARVISLILRQSLSLEVPKRAALVTPDRDLAQRVRNELARWEIEVDDSAGFPLAKLGLAAVCMGLARAILQNFDTTLIIDLLKRPEVTLGLARVEKEEILQHLEIAVIRNVGLQHGIADLGLAFARARSELEKGERLYGRTAALDSSYWQKMEAFIQRVHDALLPLQRQGILPQQEWLNILSNVLEVFAVGVDETLPENMAFRETFHQLMEDSRFLSPCDLSTSLINLSQVLGTTPFRPIGDDNPSIAIYGTLEARLLPIDILVLGGLNEGVWPIEPDAGPWLNRPMRDLLNLAQPEREIGLSAHDFAQGLGHSKVFVTWSRRISGSPANPSRWVLRFKNILNGAGLPDDLCDDASWIDLLHRIETVPMHPFQKPSPRPPVAARPKQFSVTEIENLLRDPYGIYAKKILLLQPLERLTSKSDPRIRGILFHAAIADWMKQQPYKLDANSLELLLKAGQSALLPLIDDLEVSGFWLPAFERIAIWLNGTEPMFRQDAVEVMAELSGRVAFTAASVTHNLTGRADRIDRLKDGSYRIIDYKTGEVPTMAQVKAGFSPQLLLEAAMLKEGGFKGVMSSQVSALAYIKLSGGRATSEIHSIDFKDATIDDKATQQFNRLKELLASYQSPGKNYVPRRAPRTEMQDLPYDHLSRFAEWILAEE